jgi:hypothetical protein
MRQGRPMRHGRHSKKPIWRTAFRGRMPARSRQGHNAPRATARRPLSSTVGRYAVALFIASAVLFSTPALNALDSVASADTPAQTCPGGVSQCVTVTIPCSTSSCPEITAGPTLNIGDGQYIYLSMQNFPVGDEVRVAYCPITDPPIIYPTGNPSCAYGTDAEQVSLTPIDVPVTASGTLGASFPTQVDPSGEDNAPITASRLVSTSPGDSDDTPSFFCDNSPDQCGLEVEEFPFGDLGTIEATSNTAFIPLGFEAQSDGCPSKDPLVFSDSAFSLEHFIPAAVDSTCAGDSGVADVNTATETGEVVQDFAAGGTNLAFTDDPQNPGEASELSKVKYRYIPVAVSATVVAFLGGDYERDPIQAAYPISSYDLTPNMVAGLITSDYSAGYDSDLIMPPLVCAQVYKCGTGKGDNTTAANYDTFDFLNPVASPVFGPTEYGMFFSSTESGASYQVTNWLCDAPNSPFTVTVNLMNSKGQPVPTPVQVTDQNTGPTTLTTAPKAGIAWPPVNDPDAPWPYPTCQPYPTLPVLSASSSQYSFAETPALQAKALRGYAYGGGGQPWTNSGGQTVIGFGAMDWSEASYFGLNSANIQNSAGDFVSPSESSIDAALSDATPASNGVLQYDYNDATDAAEYPMPLVTYALVPTSPQPAAASQAEGDLLTNLVCYSHSGGSIALPSGYVPLPGNLYDQARSEISDTFPYTEKTCNGATPTLPKAPPGSSKGKGGGGSTKTTKPGGSTSSHHVSSGTTRRLGLAASGGTNPTTPTARTAGSTSRGTHSTTPVTTPVQSPSSGGPGRGFEPVILALAEGTERWIVAGLAGAALLGLILGPLVVLAPRARRRLLRAHTKT